MDREEIRELLRKASDAYYNGKAPIMSDIEYDKLVEELGEPVSVGAPVSGKKVKHESPALSLAKEKYVNRESLVNWLDGREGVLSWKLDGSTVVLTYDNGVLTQAATRGDGYEGVDITANAKHFIGVPEKITWTNHLIVRGEALMTYSEFNRINSESDTVFENPRNLATATIQMLDEEAAKKREIRFYAFKMVVPEEIDSETLAFETLKSLGFGVVEYAEVSSDNLLNKIEEFKERIPKNDFPTDGLVLSYEDAKHARSLGNTGHHPRGSIALKWTDETKETIIRDVEWSVGRTGMITPVAIFDPVRLGVGSTVTRASLHNLSIMTHMPLTNENDTGHVQIGSKAQVYLSNMIIPQLASVDNSEAKGWVAPPESCPVCDGPTSIKTNGPVTMLYCENPDCAAKKIGGLLNTFSQNGLFVKGLGENQIEDLLQYGLITGDPASLYEMEAMAEVSTTPAMESLLQKDGWGEKKWENLLNAIKESKKTTLAKFIYAMNIPLVGTDMAKKLANLFGSADGFAEFIKNPSVEYLLKQDGIGEEKANSIVNWCQNANPSVFSMIHLMEFENSTATAELSGKTFVITGSVEKFKNRNELKAWIESRGGKVAGSVSSNTTALINNDNTSTSSKNKKAKELGVEIITEEEFLRRFNQ